MAQSGLARKPRRSQQTPAQLAAERDQQRKDASAERAALTKETNRWAADERDAGRSPTDADMAAHKQALADAHEGCLRDGGAEAQGAEVAHSIACVQHWRSD